MSKVVNYKKQAASHCPSKKTSVTASTCLRTSLWASDLVIGLLSTRQWINITGFTVMLDSYWFLKRDRPMDTWATFQYCRILFLQYVSMISIIT